MNAGYSVTTAAGTGCVLPGAGAVPTLGPSWLVTPWRRSAVRAGSRFTGDDTEARGDKGLGHRPGDVAELRCEPGRLLLPSVPSACVRPRHSTARTQSPEQAAPF